MKTNINSPLTENLNLEELEIFKVYDYYDQPCLFSCRDQKGQIFIGLWVNETESNNIWLYLPVSLQRFEELQSRKIDLKNAFLSSEKGIVYQVTIYKNNQNNSLISLQANKINSDFLPTEGEFLLNPESPPKII